MELLNDPSSRKLMDVNEPWRQQKIDPNGNQVKMLNWYNIRWTEDMTKGEASDRIDQHKMEIERKKKAREARQREKVKV